MVSITFKKSFLAYTPLEMLYNYPPDPDPTYPKTILIIKPQGYSGSEIPLSVFGSFVYSINNETER